MNFITPHAVCYSEKSSLDYLSISRCAAYKLIPKQFRGYKFAPTSQKQILSGYHDRLHNYQLLNAASGLVSYSHNGIFDKSDFQRPPLFILSSSVNVISEDVLHYASLPSLTESLLVDDLFIDSSPILDPPHSIEADNIPSLSSPVLPTNNSTSISCAVMLFDKPSPAVNTNSPSGTHLKFWKYGPQQTVPNHDISSSINSRNIIEGRWRRHPADAACTSEATCTYKQEMAGPNKDQWLKAIQVELGNMKRPNVFTVTELLYQKVLPPFGTPGSSWRNTPLMAIFSKTKPCCALKVSFSGKASTKMRLTPLPVPKLLFVPYWRWLLRRLLRLKRWSWGA